MVFNISFPQQITVSGSVAARDSTLLWNYPCRMKYWSAFLCTNITVIIRNSVCYIIFCCKSGFLFEIFIKCQMKSRTLVSLSRTPLDSIPDPKESFEIVPTCDSDMLKIYSWVANIFGMIRNKIGVMYKIINRTNWRIYEHEHEQNPDCFIDESALNWNNKCKSKSTETVQGS